jgi:hypothetical protein
MAIPVAVIRRRALAVPVTIAVAPAIAAGLLGRSNARNRARNKAEGAPSGAATVVMMVMAVTIAGFGRIGRRNDQQPQTPRQGKHELCDAWSFCLT